MTVFWVVTACKDIKLFRTFGEIWRLHLRGEFSVQLKLIRSLLRIEQHIHPIRRNKLIDLHGVITKKLCILATPVVKV